MDHRTEATHPLGRRGRQVIHALGPVRAMRRPEPTRHRRSCGRTPRARRLPGCVSAMSGISVGVGGSEFVPGGAGRTSAVGRSPHRCPCRHPAHAPGDAPLDIGRAFGRVGPAHAPGNAPQQRLAELGVLGSRPRVTMHLRRGPAHAPGDVPQQRLAELGVLRSRPRVTMHLRRGPAHAPGDVPQQRLAELGVLRSRPRVTMHLRRGPAHAPGMSHSSASRSLEYSGPARAPGNVSVHPWIDPTRMMTLR